MWQPPCESFYTWSCLAVLYPLPNLTTCPQCHPCDNSSLTTLAMAWPATLSHRVGSAAAPADRCLPCARCALLRAPCEHAEWRVRTQGSARPNARPSPAPPPPPATRPHPPPPHLRVTCRTAASTCRPWALASLPLTMPTTRWAVLVALGGACLHGAWPGRMAWPHRLVPSFYARLHQHGAPPAVPVPSPTPIQYGLLSDFKKGFRVLATLLSKF